MQVGACCLSWAAAPELQGGYLIFTKETLKTQEMFNEVIILAQNSPPPTTSKRTGKHTNERSPQKGLGINKILSKLPQITSLVGVVFTCVRIEGCGNTSV